MIIMLPQCIVFDLDDTLYLEREYVRSGFRAVGAWAETTLGVPDFADRAWRLFEAGIHGATFQTVLQECGRKPEPDIVTHMVSIYRCHSPAIELLPDAVHCLSELKRNALLAIVTDGPAECQKAKCASLRVRDFVDIIVCTGEWGEEFYKPHRRAFEFIQTQLGGAGCSFTYVADNPLKDFHAPIALGWETVRVRRPGGLHFAKKSLKKFAATIEIPNLWNFSALSKNFAAIRSAGDRKL
jgi:putative hydrolase of the HAD superfamily